MFGMNKRNAMKTTHFLYVLAGILAISACEIVSIDDRFAENTAAAKMVLSAKIANASGTKGAFDDVAAATWSFNFTEGDAISVNNSETAAFCTFTKSEGGQFESNTAAPTSGDATWYAYYPAVNGEGKIDLSNQAGTAESAASLYALAGSQSNPAGSTSIAVTMNPKVAILKIINNLGSIDIDVKNASNYSIASLTPSGDGFTVNTTNYLHSTLKKSVKGTYYVVVPAGIPLYIYNSVSNYRNLIKSGKTGLTAGKYYTITVDNPNLLPGLFTIDGGVKARFTKGNLYFDGSNWQIENSQIAFPTSWDANHVGHLYFCNSNSKESKTYAVSYSDSGSNGDDLFGSGANIISVSGTYAKYRNPTYGEWDYLFNKRTNHASLIKTNVTVGGVAGCTVIAPDDFVGTIASTYDTEAEVTSAGLLCLPPAGSRNGSTINTADTYYWSSTSSSNSNAYYIGISSLSYYTGSRSYGRPVRLSVKQ